MDVSKDQHIKIKLSKSGHKIPIINQIHLHSAYNPIKAETIFKKNEEQIKSNANLLVLGLGFGYHVIEFARNLRSIYGEDFKIFVLEPGVEIYNYYLEINETRDPNIAIIAGRDIKSIYEDHDLIDFLLKKPAVISHPASFNLHNDYFTKFLKYSAPNTLGEISGSMRSRELKEYIGEYHQDSGFDEFLHTVKEKHIHSEPLDFFFLALNEITREHDCGGRDNQ